MGLHSFEEVSEFLAGVVLRRRDTVKPIFIIVEEFAELNVHLVSVGESDHHTIHELGRRVHFVLRNDVVSFGSVTDGDAYLVCAIFRHCVPE